MRPQSAFFNAGPPRGGAGAGIQVSDEQVPADPARPFSAHARATPGATPGHALQQQHGMAGAGAVHPPQLGRTFRFPASRRYLWDRSATGPQVFVQPSAILSSIDASPEVAHVATSLLGAGMGSRGCPPPRLMLLATISTDHDSKCSRMLLIPRPPGLHAAPPSGPMEALVPCDITQQQQLADAGDPAAQGSAPALRAKLVCALNARGTSHATQLFAAAASLTARLDGTFHLAGRLLLPGSPLALTPLAARRLVDVPLSHALRAAVPPGAMPEDGFLTLDSARSLVPLEANDAMVYSVPLVGVWVRGTASPHHPLLLAACLRFAYASALPDRALHESGGFLVALFPPGGCAAPACYEARFHDEDGRTALLQYQFRAELLARAQDGPGLAPTMPAGAPVPLRLVLDSTAEQSTLLSPCRSASSSGAAAGKDGRREGLGIMSPGAVPVPPPRPAATGSWASSGSLAGTPAWRACLTQMDMGQVLDATAQLSGAMTAALPPGAVQGISTQRGSADAAANPAESPPPLPRAMAPPPPVHSTTPALPAALPTPGNHQSLNTWLQQRGALAQGQSASDGRGLGAHVTMAARQDVNTTVPEPQRSSSPDALATQSVASTATQLSTHRMRYPLASLSSSLSIKPLYNPLVNSSAGLAAFGHALGTAAAAAAAMTTVMPQRALAPPLPPFPTAPNGPVPAERQPLAAGPPMGAQPSWGRRAGVAVAAPAGGAGGSGSTSATTSRAPLESTTSFPHGTAVKEVPGQFITAAVAAAQPQGSAALSNDPAQLQAQVVALQQQVQLLQQQLSLLLGMQQSGDVTHSAVGATTTQQPAAGPQTPGPQAVPAQPLAPGVSPLVVHQPSSNESSPAIAAPAPESFQSSRLAQQQQQPWRAPTAPGSEARVPAPGPEGHFGDGVLSTPHGLPQMGSHLDACATPPYTATADALAASKRELFGSSCSSSAHSTPAGGRLGTGHAGNPVNPVMQQLPRAATEEAQQGSCAPQPAQPLPRHQPPAVAVNKPAAVPPAPATSSRAASLQGTTSMPVTSTPASGLSPLSSPAGSEQGAARGAEDDGSVSPSSLAAARLQHLESLRRASARISLQHTSTLAAIGKQERVAAAPDQSLVPTTDVVRTRFVPLEADSDDGSDGELDAQLMRKYGIRY